MLNSTVEITCPRCGHKFFVDVEELKRQQREIRKTIIRDAKPKSNLVSYRVQCPNDGTWVVIEIEEKTNE